MFSDLGFVQFCCIFVVVVVVILFCLILLVTVSFLFHFIILVLQVFPCKSEALAFLLCMHKLKCLTKCYNHVKFLPFVFFSILL